MTYTQELQKVRTGAARMALRAVEIGVTNLEIVPLGITYEDKVSSRARVLVEIGDHITDADITSLPAGEPLTESHRELVEQLTEMIRSRLAAVAPDYGSLVRERTMMLAASIHVRSQMTKAYDEPAMSELRAVAQQLALATDPGDDARFAETGAYQLALSASGLEDHQIQPAPRTRDLARIAVRKALIVLVITPLALIGLVGNLIAILLVVAVGAFVKEPVSKGTARVITGLVAFPLTWIVAAVTTDPNYWWLAIALALVGLVFLVIGAAQVIDLFEAMTTWWAVRNHIALLPDLHDMRDEADRELRSILSARLD